MHAARTYTGHGIARTALTRSQSAFLRPHAVMFLSGLAAQANGCSAQCSCLSVKTDYGPGAQTLGDGFEEAGDKKNR